MGRKLNMCADWQSTIWDGMFRNGVELINGKLSTPKTRISMLIFHPSCAIDRASRFDLEMIAGAFSPAIGFMEQQTGDRV